MKKLIASAVLMSGLLLAAPVTLAQDVSPQVNEAAAFFADLANSSENPVIVAMAKETLQKLNPDKQDEDKQGDKARVEVALLPQFDNTIAVTAVVNKKYIATFLVDTGAGYTVITPAMAKELDVEIPEDAKKVPITTANGIVQAPLITLKHVNLGGMDVRGVQAVVMELGSDMYSSGLLGMNFFQGLELTVRTDKLILSKTGG